MNASEIAVERIREQVLESSSSHAFYDQAFVGMGAEDTRKGRRMHTFTQRSVHTVDVRREKIEEVYIEHLSKDDISKISFDLEASFELM